MMPAQPARVRMALFVLLTGAFVAYATFFRGHRIDDAFITYRYAQNLIAGRGFVFNPGERVMASTSPGHVLLSALVYSIVGRDALPVVMNAFGVVGWLAQAAAVWFLLRGALGEVGAALVAVALAAGAAESWDWIPLETNIAFALALWAVTAARLGRVTLAAALAGLAGLFRADATLAAIALVPLVLRTERPRLVRAAAAYALVALPWPIFAWLSFGTPFPASLAAKAYHTPWPDYAVHVLRHGSKVLLARPDGLAVVGAWLLALAGAAMLTRKDRLLAVIPFWLFLHTLAYVVLRPDVAYVWHLYPTVALLAILALAALADLGSVGGRVGRAAGLFALGLMAVLYAGRTVQGQTYSRAGYWAGARHAVYESLGRYLAQRAAPDERIAAVEVGTIAYYSDRPMHDWAGLVTPRSAALPSDVRWHVLVLHQFKAWTDDPKWVPAQEPEWMGRKPTSTFRAGPFTAWLYHLDPDR
jgi:arabinofuranosyltransferase